MSDTPEGKVKKMIRKVLREAGFAEVAKGVTKADAWFYMPVQGMYSVHGMSDFFGMFHGTAWFIEAKSEDGSLTEHQADFLEMASSSGALVGVVRDEGGMTFFLGMLRRCAGIDQT